MDRLNGYGNVVVTVVDDETGEERITTLRELHEEEDRTFICAGCGERKSWDEGGADDMPDHCDECWNRFHYPEVTTPISSEITHV